MKRSMITRMAFLIGLSVVAVVGMAVQADEGGSARKAATENMEHDFYVDPHGNDSADGKTKSSAFATLEKARDAVRVLKSGNGLPAGGVRICLSGGVHVRSSSFDLTAEDSGQQGKPVVYCGAKGETASISGAIGIPAAGFTGVGADSKAYARLDPAARGKVRQIDLSQYTSNYGSLVSRGGTRAWGEVAALELFVDGHRMQLACWPDAGEEFPFAETVSAVSDANSFVYAGTRPDRWEQAEEIWLHGYWKYHYSDKHVKVTDLDTQTRTITFETPKPPYYGLEEKEGRPYYAENLLEEITVPGEWYLNRNTGILYLWPREALNPNTEVMVSNSQQPLVRVTGSSHIEFQNLTFEMNRAALLEINGGDHIVARRCTFRHGGIDGVYLINGSHNGIVRSEIYDTGNSGITISGGDDDARRKLIPSNNFVRNTHIHDVGYWSWGYAGPVRMDNAPVGVTIAHNHIHHSNSTAISIAGNNNTVEFNHIHDTGKWSGDTGVIYCGRRWDYRGNLVRYNLIHDIHSDFNGTFGVHGIYLDDSVPGFTVFGNIIHKVQGRGINARGGRDTTIQNNVLTKNGFAISIDMAGFRFTDAAMKHPMAMHYRQEPWASAYPELAAIPESWPKDSHWRYAEGSVCQRNVGFGNTQFWREGDYDRTGAFNKYDDISDNLEDVDELYVDEAAGDFRLRKDSAAFNIDGFVDIPVDKIGIQPEIKTDSGSIE